MTLDSCFSTEWCFKAREMFRAGNYKFSLTIDAIADRDRCTDWGRMRNNKRDGTSFFTSSTTG